MKTSEYRQTIREYLDHGLTIKQIAFVLDTTIDEIKEVMERNGWLYSKPPGSMPDGYFIDRLSKDYSVQDIANELDCTRAAVYRLLQRRGISRDMYKPDKK